MRRERDLSACISRQLFPSYHLCKIKVNKLTMKPLNLATGWGPYTWSLYQARTEDPRTGHDSAKVHSSSASFLSSHQHVDFRKLRCFLIPRVLDKAGVPQHVGTKKGPQARLPGCNHEKLIYVHSVISEAIQMPEPNEENCCQCTKMARSRARAHTHTHTVFPRLQVKKTF